MRISAIIAEYNPFHLGHLLHISKTRQSADEKILVIMSGSFTQRGEAAIFDKFSRTACALCCGADIVIELPTLFSLSSAQGFAEGAIRILNQLSCIDTLSFGSEIADISALKTTADLLLLENPQQKELLQKYLQKGKSFPAARHAAFLDTYGHQAAAPLALPNAILALEYLQALSRTKSTISPRAIFREGAAYLSPKLDQQFASALSIRKDIQEGGIAWKSHVPSQALPYCSCPTPEEAVFPHLLYLLRRFRPDELSKFFGMSEGLEYRCWKAGQKARTYQELLMLIKSKRYPMARIKRTLCCLLLGITQKSANDCLRAPLYARVLGVRKESRALLSLLNRYAQIPVLCSPKELKEENPMLLLDMRATDLYHALQSPPAPAGQDYTKGLICI